MKKYFIRFTYTWKIHFDPNGFVEKTTYLIIDIDNISDINQVKSILVENVKNNDGKYYMSLGHSISGIKEILSISKL